MTDNTWPRKTRTERLRIRVGMAQPWEDTDTLDEKVAKYAAYRERGMGLYPLLVLLPLVIAVLILLWDTAK